MKQELSLNYLRSVLDYNPETGIFTWKIQPRPNTEKGSIAGYINKRGYRIIGVAGYYYYAHRLAVFYVYERWPTGTDHINGCKDDNRIANLREATQSQNMANTSPRGVSGLKGAYYNFRKKKWYSRIRNKHLGYFNTKEEAHQAWFAAAEKLFGEFMRAA